MNVKPTLRDLKVMSDIYDNVFMAFYQIHTLHFAGLARPTVYNRLSKLIRSGFIKAMRVSLKGFHLKGQPEIGVIYQVTSKGARYLSEALGKEGKLKPHLAVVHSNLYHDLLLTDILLGLKREFQPSEISNSRLLDWNKDSGSRIPDAVFKLNQGRSVWALELELTMKSEMRYRDIVLQYQMSPQFECVLYITKNDAITKKIGGHASGFGNRFEPGDETKKFVFLSLEDALKGKFEPLIKYLNPGSESIGTELISSPLGGSL